MLRGLLLGSACLVALATTAHANGRPPGISTLHFQRGMETHIAAGTTFGLLLSDDNGDTWRWLCEDAIGYSGTYDPDYVYAASGTLFATTFAGLQVRRDTCDFALPPDPPLNFFSAITDGPDGTLHFAGAQSPGAGVPADSHIYRSTDDALTFLPPANEGQPLDWWSSIEVAPSNATRVYATGYRFVEMNDEMVKVVFVYRSDDTGATYTQRPVTDFMTMSNSRIEIVGIDSMNEDIVYAKVVQENNLSAEGLYKSIDGAATWTRIYGERDPLAFVARQNGDLLVSHEDLGSFRSTNGGDTWTPLTNPPHINCLVENAAGEVWACTRGKSVPGVPNDGFAMMKSTDLATWTGVMRFEDVVAPVTCLPGSVQYDRCDRNPNPTIGWCALCSQLGCDPARDCPNIGPDGVPDGPITTVDGPPTEKEDGCCGTGGNPSAGALLCLGLGTLLLRRRRSSWM